MNQDLFNDVLKQLEQNKIVSLELTHQALSTKQAIQLAQNLKRNTSLQHLNIAHNRIGYRGAQALADALKTNKTLITIDIRNNNVSAKEYITLRHLWHWRDSRLNNMLQQLQETLQNQQAINNSSPSFIIASKEDSVCTLPVPAAGQMPLSSLEMDIPTVTAPVSSHIDSNDLIQESNNASSRNVLIKTAAKDAIDELILTMIQEQKALHERFTRHIKPLISLVTRDAKMQQQITNTCFDWLTWPFVYRKNDKIHALIDIQQLRHQLHFSLSKADETVSSKKRNLNALHRDFFGFRLFKQRTEQAIHTVKQQENTEKSLSNTHS